MREKLPRSFFVLSKAPRKTDGALRVGEGGGGGGKNNDFCGNNVGFVGSNHCT